MITGIEHIAIYANDSKKLTDWYVENLNAKVVFQNDAGVYFIAFSDKSMIEICPNANEKNIPTELTVPGLRHIALAVDNFDETVDAIKKTGVEIVEDVVKFPNGVGTMFFRDIEGNILHLITRKTPLI
ncbi:MAG: VOC family protein [Clostridia bacterium]|nr:VOC family protein [Clostridia bacterium]